MMARQTQSFVRYHALRAEQEILGQGLQAGFRTLSFSEQQRCWRRLAEIPAERSLLFSEMRTEMTYVAGLCNVIGARLLELQKELGLVLDDSSMGPDELLRYERLVAISALLHRVGRELGVATHSESAEESPADPDTVVQVAQGDHCCEAPSSQGDTGTSSAEAIDELAGLGSDMENSEHCEPQDPTVGQLATQALQEEMRDSYEKFQKAENAKECLSRDDVQKIAIGSHAPPEESSQEEPEIPMVTFRSIGGLMSPLHDLKDMTPETIVSMTFRSSLNADEYHIAWLLVKWLEDRYPDLNELTNLPTSTMLEVAHLGRVTLLSASRAPDGHLLQVLQNEATASQPSVVQQALAFAAAAPLLTFRGVDASLWVQPLTATDNAGVPDWLRRWAEVVLRFGWRTEYRPFSALRPATEVGKDRQRREIVSELEGIFRQWRIHNFAFFLGNRFRQAVFPPVEGAGPLDWIVREVRKPKPDLNRLRQWAEEWRPEEYLEEVVERVRPPFSEDFFGRPKHYVLVRLNSIRDSVKAFLGTYQDSPQSELEDDVIRFVTDTRRLLTQAKHEIPLLPYHWRVAQAWLDDTVRLYEVQLGG